MIRFTVDRNGRPTIGLGLTAENIRRLKAGQPISVAGESVNIPNVDILILYGETENDIFKELKPHIGSETKLHVSEKYGELKNKPQ